MRILIAEDDPIPRRLLQATLVRAGYDVTIAHDGEEAWELLSQEDGPKLAILDWLMPGLDGPAICTRVRQRKDARYIYILLLTSKDRKEDVIVGMDAGADDYLTKPFDPHELQVRLHAGTRILELEAALRKSLDEVKRAEEAVARARKREVEIGARIQQTLLLGSPPTTLPGIKIAALTIASQQIDGDFYDFFKHNGPCIDLIVGDVMGKGVPAALFAAAIKSHFLRALSHLFADMAPGELPEPEEIVTRVHEAVTEQFIGLESFATLTYARFDWQRGTLVFVDCGNTKTIHVHSDPKECTVLEGDNIPLGVSEHEVYRQVEVPFQEGDTFCFYSDGVTEARNAQGELFGNARLAELILTHSNLSPQEIVDAIHATVIAFSGSEKFTDDLTCVVIQIAQLASARPLLHSQLDVSSALEELAPVRAFVRQFCSVLPDQLLDEEGVRELEIAVNESVSNVMRHAYHGRTDREIHVEASAFDDQVTIQIQHSGDRFDPARVRAPAFDGTRDGGFGVYMIAQCVDKVRYIENAAGRNSIELIKRKSHLQRGLHHGRAV